MPVDSEMFSNGVMETGQGNRVAEGTEQQVCRYLVYYITALSTNNAQNKYKHHKVFGQVVFCI